MSNWNRSFVIGVSCLAAGLALQTSTAFAALSDNPPSLKVQYQELDLSKSAGAEELYQRIKRAANAVCRKAFDTSGLPEARGYAQCVERAIDKAVGDVNHPLVSARWKRQTRVASAR